MEYNELERAICPHVGKLRQDEEGTFHITFLDAELDPIECTIYNDGSIDINTEKMTYIKLDVELLERINEAVCMAQTLYDNPNIISTPE